MDIWKSLDGMVEAELTSAGNEPVEDRNASACTVLPKPISSASRHRSWLHRYDSPSS